MAEPEKLGPKYRVALRLAKDPRFERCAPAREGEWEARPIEALCTPHLRTLLRLTVRCSASPFAPHEPLPWLAEDFRHRAGCLR